MARLKVINGKSVEVFLQKVQPHTQLAQADPCFSSQPTPSGPDYYFTIGSTEVFERQLKEAQELLGLDLADFIHVTYEDRLDIL